MKNIKQAGICQDNFVLKIISYHPADDIHFQLVAKSQFNAE
jgi:hypothetical protein